MYQKISEPLVVIGTTLRNAGKKETVLNILKMAPKKLLMDAINETKRMRKVHTAAMDVEAGMLVKTVAGILFSLASLFPSFGAVLDTATTPDPVVMEATKLPPADFQKMTLKIDENRVKQQLQQEQERIPQTDTRVGPTTAPQA